LVGNGVVQESGRRSKDSLIKHASHLRWQPEKFLSNLRG
jgi:hypothetical protein